MNLHDSPVSMQCWSLTVMGDVPQWCQSGEVKYPFYFIGSVSCFCPCIVQLVWKSTASVFFQVKLMSIRIVADSAPESNEESAQKWTSSWGPELIGSARNRVLDSARNQNEWLPRIDPSTRLPEFSQHPTRIPPEAARCNFKWMYTTFPDLVILNITIIHFIQTNVTHPHFFTPFCLVPSLQSRTASGEVKVESTNVL